MRLFRLSLVRQSYEIGLGLNVRITNPDLTIVFVRSTVCNHGPVLRGCMIMQSTTCQTLVRSESLSPINRLRCYRPSCLDESVFVFFAAADRRGHERNAWDQLARASYKVPKIGRSTEGLAASHCSSFFLCICMPRRLRRNRPRSG